jgi:hypothetical protein
MNYPAVHLRQIPVRKRRMVEPEVFEGIFPALLAWASNQESGRICLTWGDEHEILSRNFAQSERQAGN